MLVLLCGLGGAGLGGSEIAWEDIDDVDLYEMPAGQTTVDTIGIDAKDPARIVHARWKAVILRLGRRRSIGTEEELARLHRLPSLAGRT
jgi:hypothetical protein